MVISPVCAPKADLRALQDRFGSVLHYFAFLRRYSLSRI